MKIRIGNDDCNPYIDIWLREQCGYGGWQEWIGLTNLPYRSFSFKNPEHATMFMLTFKGAHRV